MALSVGYITILHIITCVLFISSSVHGARKLYKDTVTGEFGDILIDAEKQKLGGLGNKVFLPVAPIKNFKYFGDPRKTSINVSRSYLFVVDLQSVTNVNNHNNKNQTPTPSFQC